MASDQQPLPVLSTSPPAPPSSMHTIPMLLPVFVLIFFLICFFSIFLLRDLLHFLNSSRFRNRNATSAGNNAEGPTQNVDPGLEPAIISSFPTLPFSSVRRIQEGKCGADCAVCLGEFGSDDVIRLLTVCCHAFHPACIDSWLASHTTCPMCRSDLHAPPNEEAMLAVQEAVGGYSSHSHVIAIVDGEETKSNSPIHSMESERPKMGEYSEGNVVFREACPQV